ncbi:ABC transporter, permease protein [Pseudoalteromonas sp. 3J6]|uniref:ABC transporter permease n=1 Tax=Pseudoalteromonas sp. 3J6 TaxID=649161 RepID=UPI00175B2696|nr:ABC transporter permease [Pseudoalteromonas sp. 3J6]CAD2226254.1 ABC transporter, permease protein [Pseudoalteromonas sp. 3J6]
MFINYLVTALRSFKQQKQHFILNLLGLSIGLAAAILVALFAQNELSYDSQQPHAERVYRVGQDYSKLGLSVIPIFNYSQAAKATEYSQVEEVFGLTMVSWTREAMVDVQYLDQGFKLNDLYGATPNIENFININTLAGDLKNAMSTPESLALSESEALRIFGTINVIGNTLQHEQGQYTVRAVFADLPSNTHFAFKNLVYVKHDPNNLMVNSSYVYMRLAPQADPKALADTLSKQYFNGQMAGQVAIELHPLLDLHLTAKSPFEMKAGGAKQVVTICAGLSVLLILIAGFNFINMTVAQSAKRAKEVGVRKALGASKLQLVTQFLAESTLVALLSMIIACVLVELLLPSFNQLVDRELIVSYFSAFGLGIMAVVIAVGILAGLYPALFISSFSAKRVLSGDLQRGNTAIWVRKCLLTLQASLAIGLIIASVTLLKQLSHLQSLPLGYQTQQRLVVSELPVQSVFTQQPSALINRLTAIDGVEQATVIDTRLTVSINNTLQPTWPNGESSGGITPVIGSGFDIVKGLGLTLIAGRDFNREFSSDWATRANGVTTVGTIITETVAKQAGYSNVADIVGQKIKDTGRNVDMQVVGVVKDVKVGNAQDANSNIMFLCGYNYLTPVSEVILTVNVQNLPAIKQAVITALAEVSNIYEPKINLLAENYKAVLKGDERVSLVVLIFTGLAVFLTCLGTFGLASFATIRRQKEVAVRKVLGASRISIMNLLAKEFLILVLGSVAIAYPLTYWLVGDWLANFNERVDQALWVYLVAALSVTAITWLTVASLAFKAASTRPSLTLRYE